MYVSRGLGFATSLKFDTGSTGATFQLDPALVRSIERVVTQSPNFAASVMFAPPQETPATFRNASRDMTGTCNCLLQKFEAVAGGLDNDTYNALMAACDRDPKAYAKNLIDDTEGEAKRAFLSCVTPWWRSRPVLIGAAALAGLLVVKAVVR